MDDLKKTPLYKAFAKKADQRQQLMVLDLAEGAANLLDRIPDTFPTYTLHNRVHACNVVARIGDLLGKQVRDITALEGALLILAAYLHDIGMVFTEEERKKI